MNEGLTSLEMKELLLEFKKANIEQILSLRCQLYEEYRNRKRRRLQ